MSRSLAAGATGGLGSQVVEFLLQRVPGHEVVALSRDSRSFGVPEQISMPILIKSSR